MTAVRPDIDLEVLVRREVPPPPRRSRLRWLVPGGVLVLFLAVLFASLGDVLAPALEVSVLRPRAAGGAAAVGAAAFQAAGWVEPDPFPVRVSALTPGTLAELLVQESQVVKKGEVVARLVPDDAELRLRAARADLAQAEAARGEAGVELDFAQQDFAAAIEVDFDVAAAEADLAGRRAMQESLAAAAKKAEAEVAVAAEELAIQEYLRAEGSAGPRQVELARARLQSAEGALAEKQAVAAQATAEVAVAQARLSRAGRNRELRIGERRRIEVARAGLARAEAAVAVASAAVAIAELAWARVAVRAPCDGVVLERLAVPGAALVDGGPVASLYDPQRLRVRVDVPQEEVGKAFVGQPAEIFCEVRRGRPYRGQVQRVVQRADIQKVTLQVHVGVDDPDDLLRPEMLCQVRFRAREEPTAATADPVMLVPSRLVRDGAVWVVDGVTERATRRAVTVGDRQGEWVMITAGLNLADKLIDGGRERVQEGSRLRIREPE